MALRQCPLRLALLPVIAVAGCATAAERQETALREALASGQASLAAVGGPLPFAAVPEEAALRPAAAAPGNLLPIRARLLPPGPAPASVAELVGLPAEALRQRLGEPALRRREGPAEIWLYAGEACAVDVILYLDRPGRVGAPPPVSRVAHAAARAAGAEPRTEAACLAEIAGGVRPGGPLGRRRAGPPAETAEG